MSDYLTPRQMLPWAQALMASREPDVIIGERYLLRWHVIPRNSFGNVYLHQILHSDDDRAMHDHPSDNASIIIDGTYVEHTPEGAFTRTAGDQVYRQAEGLHRLEIVDPVITLFTTGPKRREWGFACPQGWRHWTEFVDACDHGQVGRGCD